jgi:hypothetical protein
LANNDPEKIRQCNGITVKSKYSVSKLDELDKNILKILVQVNKNKLKITNLVLFM